MNHSSIRKLYEKFALWLCSLTGMFNFRNNDVMVECLIPNFCGDYSCIESVTKCGLDVFAHNIETVEYLTPFVKDRRENDRQTLHVLKTAKEINFNLVTKSSIILGLDETDKQVEQTLLDLQAANIDFVTLGQYMQPTKKHLKAVEYVTSQKFLYIIIYQRSSGSKFVQS